MLLSKYLPLLITSFLLTITFLYVPTTTNNSLRQLLSLSKTNSICEKSQNDILERYISKDFTYIPNNKSKPEHLIPFVQNPTKHNFVNYLPRILIFSICIIIALLLIVGWFFCCCCCCCPGACCKHIRTHSPGYCGETSLVILLTFYGIIIAMSVINLGLSAKLQEGMNGTSCALFKLYDTIMNGEKEYIRRPRWEGIEDIVAKLTETQMYLNSISFDAAKSEAALEDIRKSKNSVLEDINKLDKYVRELKLNYSDVVEKYLFLHSYPLSDSKSVLGNVYNEYLIHINKPYELLLESQNVFTNLYSNKASFINALAGSIKSINDIQILLNDLSSELIDKWYDIQIKINSYGIFVYYILSILFIVFGVLGFISVFLYSCNHYHNLDVSIHITWNVLYLFSIIGMIVGSCFGIVSIVGIDSIGLFQYIFKDNLYSNNKLIFSNNTNSFELIDICFNENGRIEQALGLKELMTPLNQVFNLNKYLNESYANVNEYSFPIINQVKRNYTYIQYSSYWIRNKYAQLKTLLEYQDQKWLFKEDKCLFGDDMICRDLSCMNSIETCFYFEDWITEGKDIEFQQIMTECTSTSGKYSEAIKEVFDYAKDVNVILDKMFENNGSTNDSPTIVDTIRTSHSSILGYIIGEEGGEKNSSLKYMIGNEIEIRKEISDNIYNMYKNWLGVNMKIDNEKDVNVFEILNCGFMKYNFESLLEQIENGLSKKAFNCGIVLLIISFVGSLSNIFALIVINKFQRNPNITIKDNKIVVVKNNNINNIENQSRIVEKVSKDRLSSYSEDPLQKETQLDSQINPNISVKIV